MNARIAKKVMRRYNSFWWRRRYAAGIVGAASARINRIHWRRWSMERTPGHRWGRWDPALPIHPDELPF